MCVCHKRVSEYSNHCFGVYCEGEAFASNFPLLSSDRPESRSNTENHRSVSCHTTILSKPTEGIRITILNNGTRLLNDSGMG